MKSKVLDAVMLCGCSMLHMAGVITSPLLRQMLGGPMVCRFRSTPRFSSCTTTTRAATAPSPAPPSATCRSVEPPPNQVVPAMPIRLTVASSHAVWWHHQNSAITGEGLDGGLDLVGNVFHTAYGSAVEMKVGSMAIETSLGSGRWIWWTCGGKHGHRLNMVDMLCEAWPQEQAWVVKR